MTLASLPLAVTSARRGEQRRHRRIMLLLCALSLMGAGTFTRLPGRIMHGVRFGP